MDSSSSTVPDEVSVSYKMKKKILVERNGGVDDVEMKKSGSLRWAGETEPSPPRPRFLRYKPHRSNEILTRIQKVMEVGTAEIIEEEGEDDTEEEEDEEEEEKSGCSSLKGLLKLLCLVYGLMHWSSYMSNTNSSSSSSSSSAVHVLPIIGAGGEEGYYWRNQTLTFKGEEWRMKKAFGDEVVMMSEEADESSLLDEEEEEIMVQPEEEIPVDDNYYSSSELMKEEISNSVLDSWEEESVDKPADNDALIPPPADVQVVDADEESCSTDLDQLLSTTATLKEEEVAESENPPLLPSSSHMMLKTVVGFAVLVSVLVAVVVVGVCCYFKKNKNKKKPTTATAATTTAAAANYGDEDDLLSAPHVRVEGHGGPTVELLSELEFHFQLPPQNNNSTTTISTTTTTKKKKKTATDADDEVVPLPTPIRRSTRLHNRLPPTTPKSFR